MPMPLNNIYAPTYISHPSISLNPPLLSSKSSSPLLSLSLSLSLSLLPTPYHYSNHPYLFPIPYFLFPLYSPPLQSQSRKRDMPSNIYILVFNNGPKEAGHFYNIYVVPRVNIY